MKQCKICGSQQISGYIICGDCEKEIKLLKTELKQAVEDMQRIVQEHGECYGCVHYDHDGEICTHAEYIITCSPDDKNDRWEWRGPQDEKGAEL